MAAEGGDRRSSKAPSTNGGQGPDDTYVVPRGHVAQMSQAYVADAGGDGSVRT